MLYQPVSQWHSLHFELLIELVAKKLTELWRFKNLAYFLTWWPSSMTYLFVNVTYWNCSPIPYVDQVWWWYVKAFMSYAWQNWQTNRQTPLQTNILGKNCKFWQVIIHNKKIITNSVDPHELLPGVSQLAKGTFTLCPCQNQFQYPLQFPCPSHRLHWIRIPVSFRLNFMSTTTSPDVKVWFCIGTCKIRMETDVRISFSRSGDRSKRNGR